MRAIADAPHPTTVHQLKSFLGLANYYSKFCRNLSQILAPLYELLHKDTKWHWGQRQEDSFQEAKVVLSSNQILVHFDPTKKLVLTCDASPDGVGAVLSHEDNHQVEHPIAFASRSLNSAERNYSQLDKEALAILFGVRKFHKFIFGNRVTIRTDHKPLIGLFGEHKPLPEHASSRVQRWAITLAAYDYHLEYTPGNKNCADALSRLPVTEHVELFIPEEVDNLFSVLDHCPLDSNTIANETKNDVCLKLVYKYCLDGWPECTDECP